LLEQRKFETERSREEVGDWKVAMDLKHGRLMGGLEQDRLEVLIDGWKRD
jgi:hypothetical protein